MYMMQFTTLCLFSTPRRHRIKINTSPYLFHIDFLLLSVITRGTENMWINIKIKREREREKNRRHAFAKTSTLTYDKRVHQLRVTQHLSQQPSNFSEVDTVTRTSQFRNLLHRGHVYTKLPEISANAGIRGKKNKQTRRLAWYSIALTFNVKRVFRTNFGHSYRRKREISKEESRNVHTPGAYVILTHERTLRHTFPLLVAYLIRSSYDIIRN